MRFEDFCRVHGLIVDQVVAGKWVRVPTTDHPRKKNGAYKWLGDIGWVQNHAASTEVSTWRPDSNEAGIDLAGIARKAREFDERMAIGWRKAAQRASQMMCDATRAEHPYLHRKGFPEALGFVMPDESLLVPMRNWKTNEVMGAQVIRWVADDMRFEKKMLPGMRAKGAVFRIGSPQARRTWLVEGYATGLSVEAALSLLHLRDSVVVCFSAGNLIYVASQLAGQTFVFADNDESGAGERAAIATDLPYCMAGQVGRDANDMHQADGIFKVASLMMGAVEAVESG